MILTGTEIFKQVKKGDITIMPFTFRNLTTNSYDFHLDSILRVYKSKSLDVKAVNDTKVIKIPKEGIVLMPDRVYLGNTIERIGSKKFVPIIRGKSSTGRLGLFIHITADLIDIGSINQYTLMLHSVQPVKVYPGMQIGQVTFWEVEGEIDRLYDGKYSGLSGPQPSQIYKDFLD